MRLWHQDLIKVLPDRQLRGQHKECCALRGNGWGRPHKVVNYVFNYSSEHLVAYHFLIMEEITQRKLFKNLDTRWAEPSYRGKSNPKATIPYNSQKMFELNCLILGDSKFTIFKEHDTQYKLECLVNLKVKLQNKLNRLALKRGLTHKDTLKTSNELELILNELGYYYGKG